VAHARSSSDGFQPDLGPEKMAGKCPLILLGVGGLVALIGIIMIVMGGSSVAEGVETPFWLLSGVSSGDLDVVESSIECEGDGCGDQKGYTFYGESDRSADEDTTCEGYLPSFSGGEGDAQSKWTQSCDSWSSMAYGESRMSTDGTQCDQAQEEDFEDTSAECDPDDIFTMCETQGCRNSGLEHYGAFSGTIGQAYSFTSPKDVWVSDPNALGDAVGAVVGGFMAMLGGLVVVAIGVIVALIGCCMLCCCKGNPAPAAA